MGAKPLSDEWFEEQRRLSIIWARNVLNSCLAEDESLKQEFVVLDTESTGLDGAAEPVQITLLGWDGQPVLNTLVKPGCKIEPGAARVHGLTEDKLRHAPTFTQVLPTFKAAVAGRVVIAYNLDFDRRLIRQTVEKYHQEPPRAAGYDCAMLRFSAFWGELKKGSSSFKWHKLTDACAYMGIERTASHESLVDCQATLQLIQAMATAHV